MRLRSRQEIPIELLQHTCVDIGNFIGKNILNELCKGIADIISNGGEYIIHMTDAEIKSKPMTNSIMYQREVQYEPLVRCEDCTHRHTDDCPIYHEEWYEIDEGDGFFDSDFIVHDYSKDDGFCSWGEREEK